MLRSKKVKNAISQEIINRVQTTLSVNYIMCFEQYLIYFLNLQEKIKYDNNFLHNLKTH